MVLAGDLILLFPYGSPLVPTPFIKESLFPSGWGCLLFI